MKTNYILGNIYIFHNYYYHNYYYPNYYYFKHRGEKIKRKIIKQGHNTLTITLPKQWCEKHQISPLEELDVNEQGEILNIIPPRNIKLPQVTLDVKGLTPILTWRNVVSAYRNGYDEFKIYFDNPTDKKRYSAFSYNTMNFLYSQNGKGSNEPVLSPIEVIQLAVNRCPGIEIIDQKENWCIIKEMGETTYKEFDNALRRIFLLLLSLSDDIYKEVKSGGNKDVLKSVHIIDTNIDRFTDFCLRVLNKKGYKDFRKTSTMYTILFLLELIGDEMKKIAIHVIDAKKITPKTEGLYLIAHEKIRDFYTLFYNYSKEQCLKAYGVNYNKGHYYTKEQFNSLNDDEKEILHHLKKINVTIFSLTELRIDLEY